MDNKWYRLRIILPVEVSIDGVPRSKTILGAERGDGWYDDFNKQLQDPNVEFFEFVDENNDRQWLSKDILKRSQIMYEFVREDD